MQAQMAAAVMQGNVLTAFEIQVVVADFVRNECWL